MTKDAIIREIEKLSQKQRLDDADMSALSEQLNNLKIADEFADIFPHLQEYRNNHNVINLKKLCVEVAEFCEQLYASTQNDEERNVYNHMIERIKR